MKRVILWGILVIIGTLSACQSVDGDPLPTLASVATVPDVVLAPTETPTRRGFDLPPTFTPTFTPTESPTETPIEQATQPRESQGIIYYIYNNDAIIAYDVSADSGELVMTFGVGERISDLTASPDGQYLAFVGKGNGSAREVFLMNLDGSYLQQISCLGFQDVRALRFHNNGLSLAWYGAPDALKAGNLYTATILGSNNCPTGNNQRVLLPFNTLAFRDYAFNLFETALFYTLERDIMQYDPFAQLATLDITTTTFAISPNLFPSPSGDVLAFLWQSSTQANGSPVVQVAYIDNTVKGATRQVRLLGFPAGVTRLHWSADGAFLLGMSGDTLYLRNNQTGAIVPLADELTLQPIGTFSPTNERVAYLVLDARGVQQIAIITTRNARSETVTSHTEGTINGLVWLK